MAKKKFDFMAMVAEKKTKGGKKAAPKAKAKAKAKAKKK